MYYIIVLSVLIFIALGLFSTSRIKRKRIEEQENLEFGIESIKTDGSDKYMKGLAQQHSISSYRRCSAKIIKNNRKYWQNIKRNYHYVRDIPEKLLSLVPSAQWLIDNYYVINRENRVIKESFTRRAYKKMPCLKNERLNGCPRLYSVAREMLRVSDFHLDEDTIVKLLNAYQECKPLTISELWAFNNILKICLIENINVLSDRIVYSLKTKQRADALFDRVLAKSFLSVEEVIQNLVQELNKDDLKNQSFTAHVLYRLREIDVEDSSFKHSIHTGREEEQIDLSAAIRAESQYQASLQVKVSSAITSLIEVSAIDWEKLFQRISTVEGILNNDPSGVYPQMDFATRDEYHHMVEKLAGYLKTGEVDVAKRSVELSLCRTDNNVRSVFSHVGYYLMGKGSYTLKKSFNYKPSVIRRLLDWAQLNCGSIYFVGIFLLTIIIETLIVYYSISSLPELGMFALAGLLFFTTVISLTIALEIVNFLVTSVKKPVRLPSMDFEEKIPEECSTMVVMPVILSSKQQVKEYVDKLEMYYLANRHENLYFSILGDCRDAKCREQPEDKEIISFAVENINRLNYKYKGDSEGPFYFFHRYRKWNEKEGCWMGWERKRGKLEEFNKLLVGDRDTSYNVIIGNKQVFPKLKYVITIDADTELTKDSASGLIGIMAHPLNKPVLNKERNMVVEGYALLQPRIGVRVNYALASFFSRTFAGQAGVEPYSNTVSDVYQDSFEEGTFTGKGIYDLRVFHKVLNGTIPENAVLSHDLLEGCYTRCAFAACVELMDGYPSTVASFFRREHRWIRGDWQLLPWLFGRDSLSYLSRWKIFDNMRRSIVPVSQLAITLAAFSLLNWDFYVWGLFILFSMIFSLIVNVSNTTLFWIKKYGTNTYVSNFLNSIITIIKQGILLFILMPYRSFISLDAIIRTLYRLSISRRKMLEWQTSESVENNIENTLWSYIKTMWAGYVSGILLLIIANKGRWSIVFPIAVLWVASPVVSYYISLILKKEKKADLKPSEIDDIRQIARKTWRYFEEFFTERDNWLSPDNYQLSPENAFARRTSPTNIGLQLLSTLSARDMGFISLSSFIDRLEKIFSTIQKLERWNGHLYNWYDTRNLKVLYPRYVSTVDSGNFIGYLIALKNALEELKGKPVFCDEQYYGIMDTVKLANIEFTCKKPSNFSEWRNMLEQLSQECEGEIKPWMDEEWVYLLNSVCKSFIRDLDLLNAFENNLLSHIRGEMLERIDKLIKIMEKLIWETDFRPLYDERRELFRVGYNVSLNLPDNSYYDLLASEARLTSFLAIAKGDVHKKHWYKLGRPMTLIHGIPTLISWSGTMFEYLLPNIVMKVYPGTILYQSCEAAVRRQIEYGQARRIPWGISESGYYHFDQNLNYQYRAFGVPGLGFRSDLRKSLVVAPYATMLAIQIAPKKTYKNIQLLRSIEAEGKYGFYEALDFMGNLVNKTKKFKLIKSFMIHHQGMSLVAINNYLNNNLMQMRFHNEPMIRGNELILEELQPHGVVIKNEDEKASVIQTDRILKNRKELRIIKTTRPKYPVAHIYSNNNYTIMLTSNGNGISTWNDVCVNRWRPVLNEDGYGMFFYIRDTNSKKYWSSAYMPTAVEPEDYRVVFSQDKAEYIRKDGNIETKTEVVVSAQDSIEIRRITLYNRGSEPASLEVTSYFEPVIDTYESDLAHPAFSKLFVATEYLEDKRIMLATRRPREEDQKGKYVFSTVIVRGRTTGEVEYETDRYKFIGWRNTLRNPQALQTDLPMSNTSGNVLDPVMSMRVKVSVPPGRPAVITYVMGIAQTRDEAVELASRHQNDHAVEDVFKMALFDSEVEMQYLGISPHQVNAIQDMVGSLYYPSRLLRGPVDIIEKNVMGQSGLWKFGISGDNPIMLFRIKDVNQIPVLKDVVLAFEYLRKNGMRLDFVILNEENDDYFQPFNHQINEIIRNRRIYYPNLRKTGIFVLKSRQMSREEINLLLTAARIVLSEKNHLFSRRVKKLLMEESAESKHTFPVSGGKVYEDIPLENKELIKFNGAGGFSADGKEYVILIKDDHNIPGPWSNIIANSSFGCIVTASGSGYTWSINSRENKLTTWSNDPVIDPPSEAVYIRDDDTGQIFCPTPSPVRGKEAYRIRHGFGYSIFEHNSHGIKQKMTVFISSRDPVKVYKVSLKNKSGEERRLSIYYYVEWVMGVSRDNTAPYIITEFDRHSNILVARNTYNKEFNDRVAFISSTEDISTYTGDRMEFIGRTGCTAHPDGLLNEELSNRVGAALDPCGAVKVNIRLNRNESKNVIFILGETTDRETAELLAEAYTRPRVVDVVLNKAKAEWKHILEQVQIHTPDEEMNILVNGWLLYQVVSCRIRARSAFYQSGGAYGFRDQLQDMMALLHSTPELVREHILRCCSRQFIEGDVQHWWHEDSGKGVRTRISDDLLWLPYVTSVYISSTGDTGILDEVVPYIEDRLLDPMESERFGIPEVSEEKGTVYEHCIKAIEKASTLGEHGIPLIGAGDWNDGMNRVGWKGKGESVWLGWFVYKVLKDFIPLCNLKNDGDRAEKYSRMASLIIKSIEENAWDGEWYMRAFFDNGKPLGSRQNTECKIDSISQTWSVISKGADAVRAQRAMESLQKYLIKEEDQITLLLAPPFDKMEPSPGYIKGYLPGIRENGGQYTHAAVWNVIAYAELGNGDRAHSIFRLLNPINHTQNYSDLTKYKQEPYVMAADVYSTFPHAGRGGWSWYTGSAGWMYQAAVCWILGIVRRGDKLIIKPVIPAEWKEFKITYKFGSAVYYIDVKNHEGVSRGQVSIILDGRDIQEDVIMLEDDGNEHQVQVTMTKKGK
ncbi:MAG: GH36-type glycosyl hydrolase domain-containing protein [Acetivibrionales bacterium]